MKPPAMSLVDHVPSQEDRAGRKRSEAGKVAGGGLMRCEQGKGNQTGDAHQTHAAATPGSLAYHASIVVVITVLSSLGSLARLGCLAAFASPGVVGAVSSLGYIGRLGSVVGVVSVGVVFVVPSIQSLCGVVVVVTIGVVRACAL